MFFKHRFGNHFCRNSSQISNVQQCSKNLADITENPRNQVLSDKSVPLNTVPVNSTVEIISIIGCSHCNTRLAELGIGLGSRISIIQTSGTGPVIVLVKGSRIALGQGMCEKILVRIAC